MNRDAIPSARIVEAFASLPAVIRGEAGWWLPLLGASAAPDAEPA